MHSILQYQRWTWCYFSQEWLGWIRYFLWKTGFRYSHPWGHSPNRPWFSYSIWQRDVGWHLWNSCWSSPYPWFCHCHTIQDGSGPWRLHGTHTNFGCWDGKCGDSHTFHRSFWQPSWRRLWSECTPTDQRNHNQEHRRQKYFHRRNPYWNKRWPFYCSMLFEHLSFCYFRSKKLMGLFRRIGFFAISGSTTLLRPQSTHIPKLFFPVFLPFRPKWVCFSRIKSFFLHVHRLHRLFHPTFRVWPNSFSNKTKKTISCS